MQEGRVKSREAKGVVWDPKVAQGGGVLLPSSRFGEGPFSGAHRK